MVGGEVVRIAAPFVGGLDGIVWLECIACITQPHLQSAALCAQPFSVPGALASEPCSGCSVALGFIFITSSQRRC